MICQTGLKPTKNAEIKHSCNHQNHVISHFTNVIFLCAAAWVFNAHHHAPTETAPSHPPCTLILTEFTSQGLQNLGHNYPNIFHTFFMPIRLRHFATGHAWARRLNRKKSDVQTIPGQMDQCLHEEIEEISPLYPGQPESREGLPRKGG